MRNAAQYLRMSTEQQRYSLANQIELIRVYAERHGFTVVKSYEDAGRSGVTTARRDGLKRLLRDVVAGSQPYHRRYVHKHVHLWEAANGPIPDGYCLKSIDGNRQNTEPANWIAIPRGALPRLNGGKASTVMAYDTAPAELKPAILSIALIQQRSRDLQHKDLAA